MTAKEYLMRYRTAYREAQDIELRMAQLRLKYSTPAGIEYSDMPKAHDSEHDLSDYVAKMDELTDWLIAKYTRCMGIEADILERLDMMEKQEEREVLRLRYVDGKTWEEIARHVGTVERNVYYIHGRALLNFPVPTDN